MLQWVLEYLMIYKPAVGSSCSPILEVRLNNTSWYLSFKKGSRDLLATWQEAISQKNCDKISKERRVFESDLHSLKEIRRL